MHKDNAGILDIYLFCVAMCVALEQRSEDNFQSQLSLSTTWVLAMDLRSSDTVTRTFSLWTILWILAEYFFNSYFEFEGDH